MSTIQELAQAIAINAEALSKVLKDSGLPEPTTQSNESSFPSMDAKGEAVRAELLSVMSKLERLVLGRYQYFFDLASMTFDVSTLHTLIHFNVPELVPKDRSISYSELAKLSGLKEDILMHLVREAIVSSEFLAEDDSGKVCHSVISSWWHTNKDLALAAQWSFDHKPRAALFATEARKLDPMGEKDEICGYTQSFKAPDSGYEMMYQRMSRFPKEGQQFSALMRSTATRGGSESILDLQDWSDLNGKLMVDVGGSTGHVSAVIARKHPDVKIVVQDLPATIARATAPDAPQVPSNMSFEAYDFFTPQKVVADAYMYRSVFHNWSDAASKKILAALVPALRPGTRLFFIERIMPALGSANIYQEHQARMLDGMMSMLMNGRCRELEELKAIVQGVEPRLKFQKVSWAPVATIADPRSHSLLEWVYE